MSSVRTTFGVALSIYSGGAYVAIAGLTDIVPPDLIGDKAIDATSHDSASGIREFVPPGTKTWSKCTFDLNEIPTDAGQIALLAAVDTSVKFKVVKANLATPIIFNAVVEQVIQQQNPVNGKGVLKGTLQPTGVAPGS